MQSLRKIANQFQKVLENTDSNTKQYNLCRIHINKDMGKLNQTTCLLKILNNFTTSFTAANQICLATAVHDDAYE